MRTVLCHGCFDVLHIGHILHLREARALGDRLVVSITAAEYVALAKPGRPIFSDEERKDMLYSLRCVDYVYVCNDVTGAAAIRAIEPALYVKGSDYVEKGLHPFDIIACNEVGADVFFTRSKKYSSTEVLRRLSCGF